MKRWLHRHDRGVLRPLDAIGSSLTGCRVLRRAPAGRALIDAETTPRDWLTVTGRTIALLPMLLVLTFGPAGSACAEPAAFVGTWRLDAVASDPLEPHLERIRDRRRESRAYGSRPDRTTRSSGGPRTRGDEMEQAYWARVRDAREADAVDAPVDLGAGHPIVAAEVIEIGWDGVAFTVNYDHALSRTIRPNSAGRVFTASGEELTRDHIGRTLSYWEEGSLVVETTTRRRGTLVERLTLSPDNQRLRIRLEFKKPGWSAPLELVRVFNADR